MNYCGQSLENGLNISSLNFIASPTLCPFELHSSAPYQRLFDNFTRRHFYFIFHCPLLQSDAWIVTGGTNAGVMQLVGEAVKDYMVTQGAVEKEIVALGIVPWGVVYNKEVLVDEVKN